MTSGPTPADPSPSPPRDVASDAADATGTPGNDLDHRLAAAVERLGAAQRTALRGRATTAGLSPIQAQLLAVLAAAPPARRRVGALAAELDVTTPTVSDAVAALRRKGLLTSEPVPGDRRGQALTLTAQGRAALEDACDPPDPVATALAAHSATGKEGALALLLDVLADLQGSGAISVARTCTTCRFFRRDVRPAAPAPHDCALLGAPLALADLRVDCAEHEQR